MAQLFAAVLAALSSYLVRAVYVDDGFDGNALLQFHGHGHKGLEVQSTVPEKPIPLWVWEDRGTEPSALQKACESSWRLHAPKRYFDIRIVNRQTVKEWLPGLPPGFWRLPTEEAKSEVARAGLLAKHGGVYMDSDILLRSELITTLEHLKAADVVSFAANGQTCGKDAVSMSFMVARNKSVVATRWYEMAVQLLTTPCAKDSKVCCSTKGADMKVCKTVPKALGEHLVRKVLNEVLREKPNLRVECYDHGKSQGLEDCGAACLSQKLTKVSMQHVHKPSMAYKLFDAGARLNVSRLTIEQLRQGGSNLASELIRVSLNHTPELYLIHVPRTGGTTIEYLSRLEPYPEDRWGMLNPRVQGLRAIGTSGHKCYGQHVPPNFLPIWGNKTTFCVVRDPFDRAISEFGYSQGIRGNPSCNREEMNTELLRSMKSILGGNMYLHDCHLLPQAAYVWGWDADAKKVNTTVQHCQQVLRFEQFEHDFDKLMIAAGYPHRMEDVHPGLGSSDSCEQLTVNDLSDEVTQAIKEVYKEDFELLFHKGGLGDPDRK